MNQAGKVRIQTLHPQMSKALDRYVSLEELKEALPGVGKEAPDDTWVTKEQADSAYFVLKGKKLEVTIQGLAETLCQEMGREITTADVKRALGLNVFSTKNDKVLTPQDEEKVRIALRQIPVPQDEEAEKPEAEELPEEVAEDLPTFLLNRARQQAAEDPVVEMLREDFDSVWSDSPDVELSAEDIDQAPAQPAQPVETRKFPDGKWVVVRASGQHGKVLTFYPTTQKYAVSLRQDDQPEGKIVELEEEELIPLIEPSPWVGGFRKSESLDPAEEDIFEIGNWVWVRNWKQNGEVIAVEPRWGLYKVELENGQVVEAYGEQLDYIQPTRPKPTSPISGRRDVRRPVVTPRREPPTEPAQQTQQRERQRPGEHPAGRNRPGGVAHTPEERRQPNQDEKGPLNWKWISAELVAALLNVLAVVFYPIRLIVLVISLPVVVIDGIMEVQDGTRNRWNKWRWLGFLTNVFAAILIVISIFVPGRIIGIVPLITAAGLLMDVLVFQPRYNNP